MSHHQTSGKLWWRSAKRPRKLGGEKKEDINDRSKTEWLAASYSWQAAVIILLSVSVFNYHYCCCWCYCCYYRSSFDCIVVPDYSRLCALLANVGAGLSAVWMTFLSGHQQCQNSEWKFLGLSVCLLLCISVCVRLGSLFAFEMLCIMLGRLFEPYVVHLLPHLLLCFGDNNQYVREVSL